MAERIKKRDEIDAQWKWNLTHIFPSDEAWEAAGAEVMKEVEALAARQGHVAEDPKGVIRAYFALAEKLDAFRADTAAAIAKKDAAIAAEAAAL